MLTQLDALLLLHPELKAATRRERVTFLVAELDRLVNEAVRILR
ncbi:MAG: hypothetical protein ACYDBQ_02505 [Thermoplasmatota archaeon]